MNRECLQKFALVFTSLCITLSFSFSVFAEAFTGAYLYTGTDPVTGQPIVEVRGVNPTNQTFSGSNVIEMNAYNNAPILTSNTFNGTTSIDPAFTDITSNGNTYNGTTTITYDGITGGNLESNNDTFATANVNTSNADVELNNPTFNGSTTLQAQNVSLGSISQMDDLVCNLMMFKELMFTNQYVYAVNSQPAASSITVSYGSSSLTQALPYHSYFLYKTDGTYDVYRYRAGFLRSILIDLDLITENMAALLQYNIDRLITAIRGRNTYPFYSFVLDGEYFNLTSSNQTLIYYDAITNRLDTIINLLKYYCDKFYQWYYPLDSSAPYYWRYYNTDTELQESIGLAGLWYNISWYLGEIYQNLTDAGSDMTQDAQSLGSSISALNTAEESVNTQIQSAFSTVSGIMNLPVISAAALCISWIEYMWGSLGIFQSPTLLAYMCVILMMLVGFAKYRSAFR